MNSQECINMIVAIGIIALILGNFALVSDLHKRNAKTESKNKMAVIFIACFYYLCLIGFVELYTRILSAIFSSVLVWAVAFLISIGVSWLYVKLKRN